MLPMDIFGSVKLMLRPMPVLLDTATELLSPTTPTFMDSVLTMLPMDIFGSVKLMPRPMPVLLDTATELLSPTTPTFTDSVLTMLPMDIFGSAKLRPILLLSTPPTLMSLKSMLLIMLLELPWLLTPTVLSFLLSLPLLSGLELSTLPPNSESNWIYKRCNLAL